MSLSDTPVAPTMTLKPSLSGMTRAEIGDALRTLGLPEREIRMRVSQIWHWVYFRGARDFSEMLNVSKAMRAQLADAFALRLPEIVEEQVSADGTRKWLLRLQPADAFDKGAGDRMRLYSGIRPRHAVRLVQVGCTLNCTFCHTGTQPLVRNLTAAEIVGQVLVARDRLGDFPGASRADRRARAEGRRRARRLQHRLHGHGRAALQFRQCARRDRHHGRRRRARHVEAPHHRLDLRRRARDGALGPECGHDAGRSRCTRPATRCATNSCR